MPKKMKKTSAMGTNENKPVKYFGRYYAASVAAASTYGIQLNPLQLDARLVTVSDAFLEYRFTKVIARAWLGVNTGNTATVATLPSVANLGLAYTPNVLTTSPASLADLCNLQNVSVGNGTIGSAYPRLRLGPPALQAPGPVKWYRRGTAYDDTLEVQGFLWMAGSNSWNAVPLSWLIEYEIEFRTPADTGLTASVPNAAPTPEQMYRQIVELQAVLGLDKRIAQRVPAINTSDAKEQDYVSVAEEDVKPPAVERRASGVPTSARAVATPRPFPGTPGVR